MPKILDYRSFCEDLPEVTSLKTIGKKKFHPDGLFSEQIFGPVKTIRANVVRIMEYQNLEGSVIYVELTLLTVMNEERDSQK